MVFTHFCSYFSADFTHFCKFLRGRCGGREKEHLGTALWSAPAEGVAEDTAGRRYAKRNGDRGDWSEGEVATNANARSFHRTSPTCLIIYHLIIWRFCGILFLWTRSRRKVGTTTCLTSAHGTRSLKNRFARRCSRRVFGTGPATNGILENLTLSSPDTLL